MVQLTPRVASWLSAIAAIRMEAMQWKWHSGIAIKEHDGLRKARDRMLAQMDESEPLLTGLPWEEAPAGEYRYEGTRTPLPDTTYRWDVDWGETRIVSRPTVYFEGFPPMPNESTHEYMARMVDELPAFPPRARLYRQRWWQFWRERRD